MSCHNTSSPIFFFFISNGNRFTANFRGRRSRTWKSSGVFTTSESWTWIFLPRQLMIPPVEKLRACYCFVCYSRKNVMLSVSRPALAINFIIFVNFATNLFKSVFMARKQRNVNSFLTCVKLRVNSALQIIRLLPLPYASELN